MPRQYIVPDAIRTKLKEPVGDLIPDKNVSRQLLLDRGYFGAEGADEPLVVSVGDRTTERLHDFGFRVDLEVIDGLEKRSRSKNALLWAGGNDTLFSVENPAGSISSESISLLKRILKMLRKNPRPRVRLLVRGEEDLLALPVIALFPKGTVVFYGQPNRGLVAVRVDTEERKRSRHTLALLAA